MTHNVGEFEQLLNNYVFGRQSEHSFVLHLITGAPRDCYEFTGMDLVKKEVHLKLATPLLHRKSRKCRTRLGKRQAREWFGYANSLMRRIGVEMEIPDEAFTWGRTGRKRGWVLPSLKYEC
jgi:hypothetical protein